MASDLSDRSSARLAADSSVADLPHLHQLGLLALKRTRIPMVITDPRKHDNPIVLANEPFLKMAGYSADEVVGRNCRFMQGPDTDPETIAELRSAVAEGRETTVEILNYHRDGRPFWNQLLISPVYDEDGTLSYFFASQVDVTRQRAAEDLEAAEHSLLKEVDHRAKNALALVQAIMRLSRSDDPVTYARIVQGRVDALARAHSMLAESRWRGVSIVRLIQSQAETFGRHRISASGPVIQVDSAQVQPLALLLHEMFQNAASYGSLSLPQGRVAIEWVKDGDGDLVLRWSESGGPPLSATPVPALGMSMIRTMTERQLRGRSSFGWSPSGLEATFSFPAAHPAEVDESVGA
jgi:PAS domain S-box-containing protein